MEWIIQSVAVILAFLLALLKSVRFAPSSVSGTELARQAMAGNEYARSEQERRMLIPSFEAIINLKVIVLTVLLASVVIASRPGWAGGLLFLLYLLLVQVVVVYGWVRNLAHRVQMMLERRPRMVAKIAPYVRFMAPRKAEQTAATLASREELRELIKNDGQLLSKAEKARLLGAFDFGGQLISDAMVPAEDIITVDINDTIGPVLLDRLHKAEHNIFVAVKNDLRHVKGLLYMHDLVPLDPDLKKVKDAVRPTVPYLPVDAPLEAVLGAAVATGRQLFLVCNTEGEVKGLITLADALKSLNGQRVAKQMPGFSAK